MENQCAGVQRFACRMLEVTIKKSIEEGMVQDSALSKNKVPTTGPSSSSRLIVGQTALLKVMKTLLREDRNNILVLSDVAGYLEKAYSIILQARNTAEKCSIRS